MQFDSKMGGQSLVNLNMNRVLQKAGLMHFSEVLFSGFVAKIYAHSICSNY